MVEQCARRALADEVHNDAKLGLYRALVNHMRATSQMLMVFANWLPARISDGSWSFLGEADWQYSALIGRSFKHLADAQSHRRRKDGEAMRTESI